MNDLLIHFLLGLAVSFIGSLPPGVISITVMHAAVEKSFRQSLVIAATVSVIEFFQSFIAVMFSAVITQSEWFQTIFKYGAVPIFFVFGIYFLLKKSLPKEKKTSKSGTVSTVVKGLIVGMTNILVIPFWIVVSTDFATKNWIDFHWSSIAVFSTGITVGTMLALLIYAWLGLKMSSKASAMAFWGNKTVGFIFIGFSVYNLVKLLR